MLFWCWVFGRRGHFGRFFVCFATFRLVRLPQVACLAGGRCDWLGHFCSFILFPLPGAGLAPHEVCGMFAAGWLVASEAPVLFVGGEPVGLAVECETRHGDPGGYFAWWCLIGYSLCFTRLRSFPRAARGGNYLFSCETLSLKGQMSTSFWCFFGVFYNYFFILPNNAMDVLP